MASSELDSCQGPGSKCPNPLPARQRSLLGMCCWRFVSASRLPRHPQRESAAFTLQRSLVRDRYRPPQYLASWTNVRVTLNTVEQLGAEASDLVVILRFVVCAPADAGFLFVICNLGRSFVVFGHGNAPASAPGGSVPSHCAIRLRFCAVAVSRNSSRAPLIPRSRKRSTFRIFFMCANSIGWHDR